MRTLLFCGRTATTSAATAEKLEAAAALAPSYQKEELLRSAENFRHLAEIKGWLASELRPPKSA